MMPLIPDSLIVPVLAALAVIVIVAAVYIIRKRRTVQPGERTAAQKGDRLAFQPQARPVPAVPPGSIPQPVQKTPPVPRPKEISLLSGRSGISESLTALTEKYSLEGFTIATADGLVFASGGGEGAQTDAARFSEAFARNPVPETPGVVLRGLAFKGSDLILIIRSPSAIPETVVAGIENDTKDILNWWI